MSAYYEPTGIAKPQTWWKEIVYASLIERDGPTCYYCNKEFETTDYIHCHHIKPRIDGGSHCFSNLALCHNSCHSKIHHIIRGHKVNPLITEGTN